MAKKRKTKQAEPKPKAKRSVASTKAKFGAKAAFVRAHADLAAKDVVDLAQKAGLAMTVNHVYNVRSTSGISRRVGSSTTATARPPTRAPGHVLRPTRAGSVASESQFRRLVLELGVPRARTLLRDVESKLAALLDGR